MQNNNNLTNPAYSFANLPCIGIGSRSKVYAEADGKTVLIKSHDFVKECMGLGWFPKSQLFPQVEHLDYNVGSCGYSVYRMKKYAIGSKIGGLKKILKERDYDLYCALKSLPWKDDTNPPYLKTIKSFKTLSDEWQEEMEILIEAVEALVNYGDDVCFEISPRNVAVENGKLILLDCFFMASQNPKMRKMGSLGANY